MVRAAGVVNRRQALGTLGQGLLAVPLAARANAADAMPTLRSSMLTVAVRPSPYRFTVVERATGATLLRHQASGVREGSGILNRLSRARSARDIRVDSRRLSAQLDFEGDDAKALGVVFAFIAPEILKVSLRALRTVADATHGNFAIAEHFADQGESLYGLFEVAWPRKAPGGMFAFDRGLDNRGVEADLWAIACTAGSTACATPAPVPPST